MPVYDLSNTDDALEAADFLGELSRLEKKVDINVHRAKRSNQQNRSLYLLLGHLSNETGYTLEECKELYKQMNKGIYTYYKPTLDGEDVVALTKSSAQLTTAEMAKSIDRLYTVCAENGITLPLLTNEAEMRSIEAEMEKNQHYN